MFGGVYLDFHVAVFQLYQVPPDLHLLAKSIQEMLLQLVHLCLTLLGGVGLDFSYGWGKMSKGEKNRTEWDEQE